MAEEYRTPPERDIRVTEPKPASNLGFIVGGLVVAVALLLWFVFGDKPQTATDSGGTTNSVTVETPTPAQPVAPVPADPVTPAPGDPVAPAPADPTITPPAAPANP